MSFAEWMSLFQIRTFTLGRGVYVGTDAYGNRYFRDRKAVAGKPERRWVMFKGEAEASKVPPEWHGWLHHTHDTPIPSNSPLIQKWVKPHQPNLTGTPEAYRPPGHALEGGKRDKATGDYEAWSPDKAKKAG